MPITLGKSLRVRLATMPNSITLSQCSPSSRTLLRTTWLVRRKRHTYSPDEASPYRGPKGLVTALPSPVTVKYLAVHSWDGNGGGCGDSYGPCFNNTGHYWIDLYEVATGRRLILITGKTHNVSGDHFLAGVQWFGKHWLAFPLAETLDQFVLGNVDAMNVGR
jgi:hypothetical protein